MFETWQRDLLVSLPVARLATIATDGRPHVVPVCFALIGETVVIAIDEKPKRAGVELARLRNIRRDSRVSFLVDRYEADWGRLAWVRIDGRARIFLLGAEHPKALEALRARYPQYGPMALERLPLIEITTEKVTGWRFA
ncbi:MAG: TIGR03668 family PPOX class F420-dependent oxidoreductase [Anaerolineaceae bacterium]